MKKYVGLILFFFLLLCGCKSKKINEYEAKEYDVPIYHKKVDLISLSQNINPYRIKYSDEGLCYEVINENSSRIYYRDYDINSSDIMVCEIFDETIKDYSFYGAKEQMSINVLTVGNAARINKYSTSGNLEKTIEIEDIFNHIDLFPIVREIDDGTYLIGMDSYVYILNDEGLISQRVDCKQRVQEITLREDETVLLLTQGEQSESKIINYDIKSGNFRFQNEVLDDADSVLFNSLGEPFLITDDYIIYLGKNDQEAILDLNKQSIISSWIKHVTVSEDEVKICLWDENDTDRMLQVMTFSKNATVSNLDSLKTYSEDGRPIVHVAIPRDYYYQIEFHAKKYNQLSADSYIEIERFDDSLENYLGKGKRPDIIMFNDSTEIESFYKKHYIEDMLPFFDNQETYKFDDLIPEIKNILGDGVGLYALSGRFSLLLRVSNGSDGNEDMSASEYIKWYGEFLDDNDVPGIGGIDNVLYGVIDNFYDLDSASCSFDSDGFKQIAIEYKNVTDNHSGELPEHLRTEYGTDVEGIARGPFWYTGLGSCDYLANPEWSLKGIPNAKEEVVLAVYEYPMAIMSTSKNKTSSFDFIMYYSSQSEYLPEGSQSYEYGKSYLTLAPFSAFENVMKEEIYETEKPFLAVMGNGTSTFEFFYFTEENKEMLKKLISISKPDTATRREIYEIVSTELEPYLNDSKNLSEACDAIQKRVSLLLEERR